MKTFIKSGFWATKKNRGSPKRMVRFNKIN